MNGEAGRLDNAKLKGVLYILLSAVFFAVGSALVKVVTRQTDISSVMITFIRFFIGLLVVCPATLIKRKPLKPVRWRYVLLRALTNTFAIMFFFVGVKFTSVTKANMLNMTAPVFVFLIAPLINKEKPRFSGFLYLVLTMAGVYLVVNPDFNNLDKGDLFALMSGLLMGVATSALREARKYDEIYLIMFYLYLFSTVITFIASLPVLQMPSPGMLILIILSGFTGILGQLTMSRGFRYVDAATGALAGASRIIFAGILGISLFSDPIASATVTGGLFIIISLIGVSGFFSGKRLSRK